jgi:ketosteroid isomerase-like protein
MSQENLETVRAIFRSRTRGDSEWLSLVAPDFVMDYSRRGVDPFVLRVLDGAEARKRGRELLEVWDGPPAMEPRRLVDAGDKVLAFLRVRSRGKASGVEVEVDVAHVITFRDGRPVEDKYFGEDTPAALEAAGLSDEAASGTT